MMGCVETLSGSFYMDSEDDCSAHFTLLDMNFDSFFMIFQNKIELILKMFIKLSVKLRKKCAVLNKKELSLTSVSFMNAVILLMKLLNMGSLFVCY